MSEDIRMSLDEIDGLDLFSKVHRSKPVHEIKEMTGFDVLELTIRVRAKEPDILFHFVRLLPDGYEITSQTWLEASGKPSPEVDSETVKNGYSIEATP